MSVASLDLSRSSAVLQLDDFSFKYPDGRGNGVGNVSLCVESGQFVVICGRSGSGKSTLLRTAGGLVPHHFGGVVSGEGSVCGRDLRVHGPGELAAYCGTVFQDPEVQIVMGSVRNEIAFPLENLGWESAAIRVAVEETALALGIGHLLERRTNELSGGELQRVVLAAAIVARPPLIALDEPTSQLDPVAADELLATLARLNGDWGTTILLADHRYERALELADRVVMMDAGSIAIDAAPENFLAEIAAAPERHWLLPPTAELCMRSGIAPLPVGAKAARKAIGSRVCVGADPGQQGKSLPTEGEVALRLRGVSHSYPDRRAPAVDRLDLTIRAGQCTVLMGANGSGKSTLLRIARGVQKPDSGTVAASGEVGLLLQNPNDYLIHERVADEAPVFSLARFGLDGFGARDPRDLSGGERQRLALAIVMQNDPATLLLDEPTRGMDRERREELADLLNSLAERGTAVVVATHDAEFAAMFAERAVLLANGAVIADGPIGEVLGGGWHFATEVARLLPGTGALTPRQGAALLGAISPAAVDGEFERVTG